MKRTLRVKTDLEATRVDLFLSAKLPKYSRSRMRELLNSGGVQINGEVNYKPNFRLTIGDKVEIDDRIKDIGIEKWSAPVKISFESNDLIAIDKPYGWNSHPSSQDANRSALNAVYNYVGHGYLRLLHRLDKTTSGVLLFSKNPHTTKRFANLFQQRKIGKYYLAVVMGSYPEQQRLVDQLKYDAVQRKEVAVVTGDHAELNSWCLDTKKGNSLLLIKLLTGRRHQIRVQLANFGQPILGDTRYGGVEYSRIMLHAYAVSFEDTLIVAEPPNEFTEELSFKNSHILEKVRGS